MYHSPNLEYSYLNMQTTLVHLCTVAADTHLVEGPSNLPEYLPRVFRLHPPLYLQPLNKSSCQVLGEHTKALVV